jgi:hypothetical protein
MACCPPRAGAGGLGVTSSASTPTRSLVRTGLVVVIDELDHHLLQAPPAEDPGLRLLHCRHGLADPALRLVINSCAVKKLGSSTSARRHRRIQPAGMCNRASRSPLFRLHSIPSSSSGSACASSHETIRAVIRRQGMPPAPLSSRTRWRQFLRPTCPSNPGHPLLRGRYGLAPAPVRALIHRAYQSPPPPSWLHRQPLGQLDAQQARHLAWRIVEGELRPRFLPRDRNAKFTRAVDEVFRSEGVEVIRVPVRRRWRIQSPRHGWGQPAASARISC